MPPMLSPASTTHPSPINHHPGRTKTPPGLVTQGSHLGGVAGRDGAGTDSGLSVGTRELPYTTQSLGTVVEREQGRTPPWEPTVFYRVTFDIPSSRLMTSPSPQGCCITTRTPFFRHQIRSCNGEVNPVCLLPPPLHPTLLLALWSWRLRPRTVPRLGSFMYLHPHCPHPCPGPPGGQHPPPIPSPPSSSWS